MKKVVSLLILMVFMFLISGCMKKTSVSEQDISFLLLNPDNWTKYDEDILNAENAFGSRFKPRGIIEYDGKIGVFYNSTPPKGWGDGINSVTTQTGSLAFSEDLKNWEDYSNNPVLHKRFNPEWQDGQRVQPREMFYDDELNMYLCYFTVIIPKDSDLLGIRATGLAYSPDPFSWEEAEKEPVFSVKKMADLVNTSLTYEEMSDGVVYVDWAQKYDGKYYVGIQLQLTTTPGDGIGEGDYDHFVVVSDKPQGPFSFVDGSVNTGPINKPFFYKDKWYYANAYAISESDLGMGIWTSDEPFKNYEPNPKNPIFKVDAIARNRARIIEYKGQYAIIYHHEPVDEKGDGYNSAMRIAFLNK